MKKALSLVLLLSVLTGVFLCGCSKKSDKVTVTINTAALSPKELSDLDKFAEENGYESAKFNKRKGVIEVVIDDTEHEKLTYTLGVSVIRNVYSLIDSEEYPFIKKIQRNDIFSEMTVLVKKSAYEKSGRGDEISDFIGNCCVTYLTYEDLKEKEKVCTVKIADEKTGDILHEKTYSVQNIG